MRHQKFAFMNLSALFFAVLCLIIFACNNEGQTTQDVKDSTNTEKTALLHPAEIQFPVLYITQANLDIIFTPAEVRKIVYIFMWDATSQQSTITGFTARPQGQFIDPNTPIPLTPTNRIDPISGQFRLENLELTRQILTDLGPPPAGNTDLLFFPVIGSVGRPAGPGHQPVPACASCLTYKLKWGDHNNPQALVIDPADDELNPSPPADPGN